MTRATYGELIDAEEAKELMKLVKVLPVDVVSALITARALDRLGESIRSLGVGEDRPGPIEAIAMALGGPVKGDVSAALRSVAEAIEAMRSG